MWKEQNVSGTFLDLSKAFACLHHEILPKKPYYSEFGVIYSAGLEKKNSLSSSVEKIQDTSQLTVDFHKAQFSGLFFLLYTSMICSRQVTDFILYADYTNILCSSDDTKTLIQTINNELHNVRKWFLCK